MKTAMQELEEWMVKNHFKVTLGLLDQIEYCRQKEKEQIINAHGDKYRGGFNSSGAYFDTKTTGEEYYNQTYNQDK